MITRVKSPTASVAKTSDLGTADITTVYTKIYGAITDALRLLGVPADFSSGDAKNCPNLTVNGKKISGSSQTITRGVVLQHGTILRSVDIDKMFQLLQLKGASLQPSRRHWQTQNHQHPNRIRSQNQPRHHRQRVGTGLQSNPKNPTRTQRTNTRRKRNGKQTLQRKIHNKRMEFKRKNRLSLLLMPPYTLRSILKHDTHGFELGADGVGFFPILGFPCILTLLHQGIDVCG